MKLLQYQKKKFPRYYLLKLLRLPKFLKKNGLNRVQQNLQKWNGSYSIFTITQGLSIMQFHVWDFARNYLIGQYKKPIMYAKPMNTTMKSSMIGPVSPVLIGWSWARDQYTRWRRKYEMGYCRNFVY